ncbi:MAG: hypothetical protein WBN22_10270 [Verrucomicrobiia bacterium]
MVGTSRRDVRWWGERPREPKSKGISGFILTLGRTPFLFWDGRLRQMGFEFHLLEGETVKTKIIIALTG